MNWPKLSRAISDPSLAIIRGFANVKIVFLSLKKIFFELQKTLHKRIVGLNGDFYDIKQI